MTETPPAARPAATRETLRRDLEALGLRPGDVVLVRADVGEVGRVKGGTGDALIGALRDAVGPEGTLVALAFTRTRFLWRLDPREVFDEKTPPTTSFVSANGPSIISTLPRLRRTRAPLDVGRRPAADTMAPALDHSPISFPMAASSSGGTGLPAS